jgi:hypothetical protein
MRVTLPIITATAAFICANAAPASACFRHTFEPCQATTVDYKIGLDPRTGRTWIKEVTVPDKTADQGAKAAPAPRLAQFAQAAANELAPPSPWKARINVAP